jgi:single-strand DNA-binding protein
VEAECDGKGKQMDSMIWMSGNVGGDVEFRTVRDGLVYADFRLGCTPRYWRDGEWVDAATTWITVNCNQALAENIRASIRKGDAVVVVGRLRTSRWNDSEGTTHERLQIEASIVGHDLSRGVARFQRTSRVQAVDDAGKETGSRTAEVADGSAEPDEGAETGATGRVPAAA